MNKKDRYEKESMKKRSEVEYVWGNLHRKEKINEMRKPKNRYIVNK